MLLAATAGATALRSPLYDPVVITENGKFKPMSLSLVRKLLKPQPELFKLFKEDTEAYEKFEYVNIDEVQTEADYAEELKVLKDYLNKLNDALKHIN